MILTVGYFVIKRAQRQLAALLEKWKADDEAKYGNNRPEIPGESKADHREASC